jgi:hypothetical protein
MQTAMIPGCNRGSGGVRGRECYIVAKQLPTRYLAIQRKT